MSSQKGKIRSGIGGRTSTKKSKAVPKKATYFDLLREKQSGQRGQSTVSIPPGNEENVSSSSDPLIYAIDTSLCSLESRADDKEELGVEGEMQEDDDDMEEQADVGEQEEDGEQDEQEE